MIHSTKGHPSRSRNSVEKPRTQVSPIFQIIFIFISIAVTAGLLYEQTVKFDPKEPLPTLSPITPSITKQFGEYSELVAVGLYINRFDSFNVTNKDFVFDGTLWFSYPPGAISVETLSKFSFENGTIIQKSEPILELIDDKLTVQYSLRVRFISELDYSDFPLDTHRLTILLVNRFVSPREVNFITRDPDFNITADVSKSGWDEVDRSVNTGYIVSQLSPQNESQKLEYPAALFEIDYVRNSIRYALTILLPLALIFYVMLFSISLPIATAISITAAGITAILAYRFVIENLSPRTGYFMLSDYLFFLFLSATIFVFIMNVAETTIVIPSWMKKILIIVLHILIISATIYLFLIR